MLQIKRQESSAPDYTSQMQALQRQATEMRRNVAQIEWQLRLLSLQRLSVQVDYRHDNSTLEEQQVEVQANSELVVTAPALGWSLLRWLSRAGDPVRKMPIF